MESNLLKYFTEKTNEESIPWISNCLVMPIFCKKEVLIPVMMKLRTDINNTNFKIFLTNTSLVGKGYKTSLSTRPFVEENPVLIAIPLFYFLFLNCKMVDP